jgi:hypothetical protein
MSDEKTTGGYENDLRDAENAMIAAGHPEIAQEMRRHSEAIRNYMQGAIVPMFVQMVERVLGQKIDPVAIGVAGLRTDVQQLALESAARLGKIELDNQALKQGQVDILGRLQRKRVELDEIHSWIAEFDAFKKTVEERIRRTPPEEEMRELIAFVRQRMAAERGE